MDNTPRNIIHLKYNQCAAVFPMTALQSERIEGTNRYVLYLFVKAIISKTCTLSRRNVCFCPIRQFFL